MAADILFPIYDLMMDIFGSILVSALALAVVITIISLLGRVSGTLYLHWMILFALVFLIAYIGGLAAVFFSVIGGVYLISSLIRRFVPRD